MDTEPKKSRIIPASIAIAVVLIIGAGIWYYYCPHAAKTWVRYHQETYGFDIKYPQSWRMADSLSQETCCLFVYSVDISTTTSKNAGGTTTVTVTAKEPIKIQIGYYYKTATYDPFKMSTTTAITLGKNVAYTGVSNGTLFYLIPTSHMDGIGAAIFTSVENTDTVHTRTIVNKILSTIVFTGTSTNATSTDAAASAPTATSTSK
jgi:hypothetical protein